MTEYVNKGAVITAPHGTYRYKLWRTWAGEPSKVLFVCLNPSTADGDFDDPTVRKMVGFAKTLNHNCVMVCNLFAHRATDPRALKTAGEPVGWDNDYYLLKEAKAADRVVCAWGTDGKLFDRDLAVYDLLSPVQKLYCLGTNKDGTPKHPLYLPYSAVLQPYEGRP